MITKQNKMAKFTLVVPRKGKKPFKRSVELKGKSPGISRQRGGNVLISSFPKKGFKQKLVRFSGKDIGMNTPRARLMKGKKVVDRAR